MVGILVLAPLEIRREWPRRVRDAGFVDVGQSLLSPVGAGKPSQHVIERAILHHQHDHGVERRFLRLRQRAHEAVGIGHAGCVAPEASRETGGGHAGGSGEEVAARDLGGHQRSSGKGLDAA